MVEIYAVSIEVEITLFDDCSMDYHQRKLQQRARRIVHNMRMVDDQVWLILSEDDPWSGIFLLPVFLHEPVDAERHQRNNCDHY
jgi:hypothetical protein